MPDASRETATPSDEPAGVAAGEPPDEHLGALMDSSPDPIVGVAPDGTITAGAGPSWFAAAGAR